MKKTLRPLPGDWSETRIARQWESPEGERSAHSYRTPQQRDRDRVLYSSAFQRLAYITQVTAPESGHSFHNRLSHSLKVAQVGRRNIERLQSLAAEREISGTAAELLDGIDPDAVEASCLAHDLGHPPFGHIAESVLQEKASDYVDDGFEGNAQSFRVVSRLAVRDDNQGLNLTRETLDSMLKYPWRHWTKDPLAGGKREGKWGYYVDDRDAFEFARQGWPAEDKQALPARCIASEIMDWGDDLTYAVHDVDDFFRAGLVPLDRLRAKDDAELKRLGFRLTELRDEDPTRFPAYEIPDLIEAAREMISLYGPGDPYQHTISARAGMRQFGSKLITRYLEAFVLGNDGSDAAKPVLRIDPDAEREVAALKMLVVVYVIHRPGLAVVQHGQKRLIAELFEAYFAASSSDRDKGNYHLFPPGARERLEAGENSAAARARTVVDLISGLTETAAVQLHARLGGSGTGAALDATALIG